MDLVEMSSVDLVEILMSIFILLMKNCIVMITEPELVLVWWFGNWVVWTGRPWPWHRSLVMLRSLRSQDVATLL